MAAPYVPPVKIDPTQAKVVLQLNLAKPWLNWLIEPP